MKNEKPHAILTNNGGTNQFVYFCVASEETLFTNHPGYSHEQRSHIKIANIPLRDVIAAKVQKKFD